jgi:hypothetical protein
MNLPATDVSLRLPEPAWKKTGGFYPLRLYPTSPVLRISPERGRYDPARLWLNNAVVARAGAESIAPPSSTG